MTNQTWGEISARAGRNRLPALFFEALFAGHLNDEAQIADALEDSWTGPEWPEKHADQDCWRYAFEQAGFVVDGKVRPEAEKPEEIVLYRGATAERALGMSWTTDLDRARWFAGRFQGMQGMQPTAVYRITATADEILAQFTTRGEAEWVVDTSYFDEEDMAQMIIESFGE